MLKSLVNDGTMLFSVPFSILAETPSGPLALDVYIQWTNKSCHIFCAKDVIWTVTGGETADLAVELLYWNN